MHLKQSLAAAVLAGASLASFAQLAPADPDWREAEAPLPSAPATQRLIELDIPRTELRYGIDPGSVSVGKDGVVRYVVVARSPSGTVNALYEGIHCSTGQVKVYARHNPDSGWARAQEPQWKSLHEGQHARYSLLIARSGACLGHSANGTADKVVRDLRANVDVRFR